MPLEFGPPRAPDRLVREMLRGRLPAGSFTDDTEMALALAESLIACGCLDPQEVMRRFVDWARTGPDDIGIHTSTVLSRAASGISWERAAGMTQQEHPQSAGNGSVMRCWPVALAAWDDLERLLADSRLQSGVTHAHLECVEGSAFANAVIYELVHGARPAEAVAQALALTALPTDAERVVREAPSCSRDDLRNTGWVRHTLESATWGLVNSTSFEEAVVQVVNLGGDADTAGAVVGAWAGATYGLSGIPIAWRSALRGEWPLRSGQRCDASRLVALADRLIEGR